MSYAITGNRTRCTFDTVTGGRCALAEGHKGQLHVTVDGDYFAERGGKTFGPVLGAAGAAWGGRGDDRPWWAHQGLTDWWAEVANWKPASPPPTPYLDTLRLRTRDTAAYWPADPFAAPPSPRVMVEKLPSTPDNRGSVPSSVRLDELAKRDELATKFDNDAAVVLEQRVQRLETECPRLVTETRELADNLAGRLGVVERHRLPQRVEAFEHTAASLQRQVQVQAERTHHIGHSAAVRNLREELDRKLTALHRVEYGGGLAGIRRDINHLVGLVGDVAWNARKALATEEDLAGTDKAVAHLNERLSALENQTTQLGKLAQCSAYSGDDGDRYCVRVNHHDGTHLGEDGFAW